MSLIEYCNSMLMTSKTVVLQVLNMGCVNSSENEDSHKTVPEKGKEVSKGAVNKRQQKEKNTNDYWKIDQHARQVF